MYTYARRKSHLAQCYDYYFDIKSGRDLHFRNDAETVLEAIKQKKLFNLQLKWRAEQIVIPEINFRYDFVFWGEHIDACTFLPPVTAGEIEVMKQYLKEEDAFNQLGNYTAYDWQDYDEFMSNDESDDPNENMPAWYEFYDSHMGTGFLLLLPNTRGKKEEYYEDLGRKDFHKKNEEERQLNPPPPYVPPPPHLYSDEKIIFEFVKTFETDKYFLRLFEIYLEEQNRNAEKEQRTESIDEALDLLQEATIPIMMPGGYEWHRAIIKCAKMYESEMIIKELDALYDEYRMFNELGIYKGSSSEELQKDYENDGIAQMLRGFILRGRELTGEPKDFNF